MTYDTAQLTRYMDVMVERHLIWQRRQNNEPQPWTTDPVLVNLKTTNCFRVLDPGSQFVFDLDTKDPIDAIARLVFYRLTNLPKTWRAIRNAIGRFPLAEDFRDDRLIDFLDTYRNVGNKIFSGAYIIVPEPGTTNDKIEGAVRVVRRFVAEYAVDFLAAKTQDQRFAALHAAPGLGPFLSMQILTDWGYIQREEPDLTFIVAGPGAQRGAKILAPIKKPEDVIYDLTIEWMDHPIVHLGGRSLTVMDVQNTLCEWGKIHREEASPRRKNPYKPAHPGKQPLPILPQWW